MTREQARRIERVAYRWMREVIFCVAVVGGAVMGARLVLWLVGGH